ncbi:4-(cytidine 5'-diphospho)-2-C-methyl-D-erythritol kinase [Aedoeadaptatus urinae]|uniref:4-(cytidine 5'-diphospho)-2-C-methyl-D-erythritol kinase n=1 Tax=Aedoeadaptatus urinae TaxID=1871017 RepID=UPI00097E0C87|nr:4-(cytidine 5'-diphospho)-2-C-methyl-D-erythritol kinase [Peptoniphilus urinae]
MRAYGKINVGLWVSGKRADGYHEIKTLFLPIGLYDDIAVSKARAFSIEGPHYSEKDLMTVAHRFLEEKFGPLPVHIRIEKNIPAGAGLAGGTADGAAVLKAVRDLYSLPISDDELIPQSAVLGADFPYCLYGRAAVGEGIGDKLRPVSVPSYPLLLLNPGFAVSTKDAYAAVKLKHSDGSPEAAVECLASGRLEGLKDVVANDLYDSVAKMHPVIDEMIADLYEAGCAFSHMSGSGPTVYGLFKKVEERDVAYAILREKYAVVIKTKILGEEHGETGDCHKG